MVDITYSYFCRRIDLFLKWSIKLAFFLHRSHSQLWIFDKCARISVVVAATYISCFEA